MASARLVLCRSNQRCPNSQNSSNLRSFSISSNRAGFIGSSAGGEAGALVCYVHISQSATDIILLLPWLRPWSNIVQPAAKWYDIRLHPPPQPGFGWPCGIYKADSLQYYWMLSGWSILYGAGRHWQNCLQRLYAVNSAAAAVVTKFCPSTV